MAEKDKREAVAERQKRWRRNKEGEGMRRLQVYVPAGCYSQLEAIAKRMIDEPTVRFVEAHDPPYAKTYPLQITQPTPEWRKKGTPKYRHPTEPEQTWTGRGRLPPWVSQWKEQGNDIEQLRIGD